jgi:hypothetical protein
MSSQIDLPRLSKGARPQFFEQEGVEHLLAMVLELTTELAVAYDRTARLEQVLIAAGVTTQEAIDNHEMSDAAVEAQDEWSSLLLDRLYSSVQHATKADNEAK